MRFRKLVMLALLICSVASIAYSLPPNAVQHEWYDDATYTNMVGWKNLDCSGYVETWGVQTNWWRVYKDSCSTGGFSCQTCYKDSNGITHCNWLC